MAKGKNYYRSRNDLKNALRNQDREINIYDRKMDKEDKELRKFKMQIESEQSQEVENGEE
jgi:hypothetical protein